MNAKASLSGLMLIFSATTALAAAPSCLPTIDHAWIRVAPPGAMTLAGYARVHNHCKQAVAIVNVSSVDFAMSMIHETVSENGVSKMRHVDSLPLPADGSLSFDPGGRHLMLMQPRRELKSGDQARLTLKLADGRSISADFIVRPDPPK